MSVAVDDQGLRVIFAELTSERRSSLIKVAKSKLEEAKISLRNARDEVWNEIQEKQKGGELSEDDKFRFKEEMGKLITTASKKLDEMGERKEKEIAS